MHLERVALDERKAELCSADIYFRTVHNFLTFGIRRSAGERPSIVAVEDHDEDFLAFIVITRIASVDVMRNLKTDAIARQILGQNGGHVLQDGKNHRAERSCSTFVPVETPGDNWLVIYGS